ncbi:uncharacterized protein Z520_01370 [Fonsecaea multimorphosa CBS 102226]|uniref:BTB domain-containing protein n=1 Tax=Fonsecaea multimorphosa CBS 102226 TaxID=1442371 RepID=A0A0D2KHK7_9EURO|nr:uncharacterized protein Z520_01370 [Fonsecaea multimorphosa CBS 102226]KIY02905.1 hypothetical protein Z520_01370 [Fonsecaea multimorphosa CBS 102226]OAL30740.1 hypothetical protein AYO22_01360 [Fonsecaea multimorphosa]
MVSKRSADEHEDGRAKKRSFAASDDIITVYVGPGKVRHLVHESVLCRAPFFEKCLHSGMREQLEKAISLPEETPEDFVILVEWLYSGTIPAKSGWSCMLRAYNAAQKFCMPDLQNALVDLFRSQMVPSSLSPEWVSYIWKSTAEGCQLRQLVLDLFYYHISKDPSAYKKDASADPWEMPKLYAVQLERLMAKTQLVMALFWRFADRKERPSKDPAKMKGCVYHVHEDGNKCT